jgi:peptide/nickel transport system substrate-binding protein
LAELQAGSIDFSTNLGTDARETLDSDEGVKEVEVEPFNIAYVAMNFNSKPFDDVRVRQAVAHAIDKQAILDAFYGGEGEVANTFLPASLSDFRAEDAPAYEYDPERAQELLAEAGYPDGFDTMTLSDGTETALQFWYMPVSRPYYPNPKPIAEAIQSYLGDVGINAELQTEDWGVYLDNVDAGKKNGMWMLGWTGDYGDPNNFLYTFFGPSAATQQGYNNAELVGTLTEAGQAPSLDDAAELFREAGTVIAQDVPRIPIVHSPPVYGAREGLEGWTPSRYGSEPWKTLFIEK